eukprot:m51a1_g675 hypothetical protein (307) ;mRNA; f:267391-269050
MSGGGDSWWGLTNVLSKLGITDAEPEVAPEEAVDENGKYGPPTEEGAAHLAPQHTALVQPYPYPGTLKRADGPPAEGELLNNCYSIISGTLFNVRGRDYLVDRVKIASKESICELAAVDVVTHTEKVPHIAARDDVLLTFKSLPTDSEYLIVNFQVPYANYWIHWILYWRLPREETEENSRGYKLLKRFMNRDEPNEFRDTRFKIIPSVYTGPWLVKKALGNTPAILPNKLTTVYVWGERHLEMDVDVGSSVTASYIVNLVLSYVCQIELDLACVIEAKEDAELPEHVLGAIRAHRVVITENIPAL